MLRIVFIIWLVLGYGTASAQSIEEDLYGWGLELSPIVTADQLSMICTGPYLVLVDNSLTLADMVAAGGYDEAEIDRDMDERYPGIADSAVEVTLARFSGWIKTDDVLCLLERNGYRPATLPELLAFGASHPSTQRHFPIIAFVSVTGNGQPYLAVCLDHGGQKRYLYSFFYSHPWCTDFRFAVVRLK